MKNLAFPARALRLAPLAGALALGLSATAAAHTDPYALQLAQRQARASAAQSAAAAAPAGPSATLPVTSCADDADPGTLRNVLAAAGEGDTVDLSQLTCSTITLTQGPIDTSVLGDHHLYDVTLQGPGRDKLTIDGGGQSQVFVVGGFSSNRGTFTANDLTVANGTYTGSLAACLHATGGTIALNRVLVTNCHASGTYQLIFGGAIDASSLTLTDSVVSHSTSTGTGAGSAAVGAGFYVSGDATLVNSTVSGNAVSAPIGSTEGYATLGGGAYVRGNLTMTNSTISGNSVEATNDGQNAPGGGLYVKGFVTIDGSTIDGNRADGDGGGLFKSVFSPYGEPPPPGDTKIHITNSTISGNSAARGGGIATARPLYLANSTLAFNSGTTGAGGVMFVLAGLYESSGVLDLQSSIVAGNSAGDGATLAAGIDTDDAVVTSGANSLVQAAATAITLPADTLDGDPLLLPLSLNGGATRTHALGAGSPAIDVGNNTAELSFDQRGERFARVSGAAADIGAFEWQQPPSDGDRIFKDGFDGAAPTTTVEYSYDDGDGDTNQGPPRTFDPDMLWGNYYLAQPGGEIITKISVAFGPTFPSLANGPVTFWLLQDDDADMDPRNAHVVASVPATPNVSNDDFYTVEISPTWVHGGFFVGASAKLKGGDDKPARVDRNASGDKSWFFYAPDIAATIDDLAAAPFGTRNDNTQYVALPGAFMVRATGTGTP